MTGTCGDRGQILKVINKSNNCSYFFTERFHYETVSLHFFNHICYLRIFCINIDFAINLEIFLLITGIKCVFTAIKNGQETHYCKVLVI